MVDFTFSPYGEDPDDILRGLAEHIVQLKEQNETLKKALEEIRSYCNDPFIEGHEYLIYQINDIVKQALKDIE